MFICQPCLNRHYENWAPLNSHGRCESCGIPRACVDIHHSRLIEKPKKPETKFSVTLIHTVTQKHVIEVMASNWEDAKRNAVVALVPNTGSKTSQNIEVSEIKVIHPKGKNG